MRLLVDVQSLQGDSAERGIGNFTAGLTRALVRTRGEHEVSVLLDGGQEARGLLGARSAVCPPVAHEDVLTVPSPSRDGRDPLEAEVLRECAIAASGADVVLLTSIFELAPGAPMTVNEHVSRTPTAAVLHDLIPLGDLDAYKPDRTSRATYLGGVARLPRLDLLLTNSDHTAREASRLVPSCPDTATVRGAAADPAVARRPVDAPRPGFGLAVGRHEPRKDVRTAVLAWARLPPELRGRRPMVVVGVWDPAARRALQVQAAREGLPPEDLRFVQADDAELRWYYENALVLLFPSREEGLGMPPLEAAAAGTPTLLASSSSLVELTDDDRVFVPVGDVDAFSAKVGQLLTDPDLQQDLVRTWTANGADFSWEAVAGRAWAALERLAATKPCVAGDTVVLRDDGGDLAAALVETPAVALLRAAPPSAAALLAPAVGLLVERPEIASDLLREAVISLPIAVVDPADDPAVRSAAQAMRASEPLEHWVAGAAAHGLPAERAAPLLRRPLWACRPRGPLLGTDVSLYRHTPFLSGIQRTVERLHGELDLATRERGGALLPVELGLHGQGAAHPVIAADPVLSRPVVDAADTDWALCLDLDAGVVEHTARLTEARAGGTRVATNVFDCLPWVHPEWWPPGAAEASFTPWLRAVVEVSDVLLVNSVATATDLERFVARYPPRRPDPFAVQLLRLGSDFAGGVQGGAQAARERGHLLMVSTVEPRKGHARVLDALEELWQRGHDVRLTVVGRAGWMVDDLARRMRRLSVRDDRFTWLEGATDDVLDELYARCSTAVVASEAEGFGLPVVEAAGRGCPVLVHDVPVLRELAGPDATYFGRERSLVEVLEQALADPASIGPVAPEAVLPWADVARRLMSVLDGDVAPLASWRPGAGWDWSLADRA